jgi:glutamate/tyrosine decarboxylase-like PLP-dependent enzyme
METTKENPGAGIAGAADSRIAAVLQAAQYATEYLEGIGARAIAPDPMAAAVMEGLRGPVPEESTSAETVLKDLYTLGSPMTIANGSGRYFGFVNGGTVPAAMGAGVLVNAWDQNAGLQILSPVSARLEETALGWVRELLGLPEGTGGAVVTGATMANFCGLAAARHALLQRAGWNVEEDGLFGAPELHVLVGDEVHTSLTKALSLLGLGKSRVTRIPVDGQGRMRADKLPPMNERTILCLQAGNVNTGAFDPAAEICPRVRAAGAWIHVDGAFGLWAATSPKYRHLVEGYDLADSWATDAHKWPNVGYDCGVALVRDPGLLKAATLMTAAYLTFGEGREPSHYTPEMSRRARGVELWAALRSLGREGLALIVERTCAHARRFAVGLQAAGYAVLNDVVINQVLVSFGSAEKTLAVVRGIQQEGTCWCGSTVWQGRTAMRISVSSWVTSDADVDLSLAAMLRVADAVETS